MEEKLSEIDEIETLHAVIHEHHAELFRIIKVLLEWSTPESLKLAREIGASVPGRGEWEIKSRLVDPNNVLINRRTLNDLIEDTAELYSQLCLLRNNSLEPWHKEVVGKNLKEWQKLRQKLGYDH